MEISILQVLASAFGGAAVGSIITGGIAIWLNKQNYKQDYYKKIIDKRIESYEQVSNLKKMLESSIEYEGKNVPCCFYSEENVEKFKEIFDIIVNNRMWLSPEMQHCIIKLDSIREKFLEDLLKTLIPNDEKNINEEDAKIKTAINYTKIAVNYFRDIDDCREQISNVLEEDWKNLHDVKIFFKSIKKIKAPK